MILFLYGEDTFSSYEKLASIKRKYIDASLGDTNLYVQDVAQEKLDYKRFEEIVTTQPFLAKKRLIIFKNILKNGSKKLQEKIVEKVDAIPKTSVVLFYEQEKVDRRSKLFRTLNKPKISQEFKKKNPHEVEAWIEKKLRGSSINSKDKKYIVDLLVSSNDDLWQVSSNTDKVMLYLDSQQGLIDENEIKMLISKKTKSGIFDFIDLLANQDALGSYRMFHDLLEQGENAIYVFTMIVYQFRNLLVVKDLVCKNDGNNNSYALSRSISQKAKINPYVVGKTLGVAEKYSLTRLKEIYQMLFEIDAKIKSGKIDPVLAIDLLIYEVSKVK